MSKAWLGAWPVYTLNKWQLFHSQLPFISEQRGLGKVSEALQALVITEPQ